MSSYQLRPAGAGDAEQVAAVHASSSHVAYEAVAPEAGRGLPLERRRAFWREAIQFGEPQVQVAVENTRVIGFVGFDRSRDPQSKATTGEIWALYVAPTHWGMGVGRALWDAARAGLIEEGCTEVTLWVPQCNERALRFFEQAGFERESDAAKTAQVGSVKLDEIRLRRRLD
jgi:ribosomal protein S18 acetylase RimI-like enzyme